MSPVVVSAHNPMTGPRHLGHYVSTMIDWPKLQHDHEIFIVIDDLIAAILYPASTNEIQDRTFHVAKEFISTGINIGNNHIVLTSMVPEAFELDLYSSILLPHSWCTKLYEESFAGILNSGQRRDLQLPRLASVAEVTYPQIHLASFTLGLRAEFFQGGEEMRGYLGIMEMIAEELGKRVPISVPRLMTAKSTFLIGYDGQHMSGENAIYLSASEVELQRDVSKVQHPAVLREWVLALDRTQLLPQIEASQTVSAGAIRSVSQLLIGEFSKFRESRTTNREIAEILETSSLVARERIKDTLSEVKAAYGVPGFRQ